VKYVYDGDTILINSGEKVRYLGIDAPELEYNGQNNNRLAEISRDFNLQFVKGKRVRIDFDKEKKDQYGRLLAYVFLENGEMINSILIRHGLAHIMITSPNKKYFGLLLGYQQQAMNKKIGIWQNISQGPEKHYLGSKKSYRFHKSNCPYAKKIPPRNLIGFRNRYESFWAGFSPCKKCMP
jgi:endonuclease YncB( thermonuclease family)